MCTESAIVESRCLALKFFGCISMIGIHALVRGYLVQICLLDSGEWTIQLK